MTPSPLTIDQGCTLTQAHEVMRAHHIRHLPVLHGGKLVGIVSQRDLALVESLPDVDPGEVQVEEAMSTDVYTLSADAPLLMAANEMAERRIGSAVVTEGGRVVGVFTEVDACRSLAQIASYFISAAA